jgi:hypothetical protein
MTGSRILNAGLVTMALAIAAPPAVAQYAMVTPFRAMAGSWSGGGTLSMANGESERIRCRANYNPGGGGDELRLSLRCASASYNFDLTSNVQDRGGAISGQWTEASRNASGVLSGRSAGDRIEATARGQNFSANISLTTRGNRQTVSIRPEGQSDVRAVSLALERR